MASTPFRKILLRWILANLESPYCLSQDIQETHLHYNVPGLTPPSAASGESFEIDLKVTGMACEGCADSVRTVLGVRNPARAKLLGGLSHQLFPNYVRL